MDLVLDGISKLYSDHWVFRHLSKKIDKGTTLAISGPNGSGKSTLLSIILGLTLPSEGTITYFKKGKKLHQDNAVLQMSFSAPYLNYPPELTVIQAIESMIRFRPLQKSVRKEELLEMAMLKEHRNKLISKLSTGMYQRLRNALAIALDSDVLILDEPTSNLDEENKLWFRDLMVNHLGQRTLIMASNDKFDLDLCEDMLSLKAFQ